MELLEWDARSYDALPLPHLRWGADVIERLGLLGDEVVADLGCGTGRDTVQLLGRLPRGRVVAADGSGQMLAQLRARVGPDLDRVQVVQTDLRRPLESLPVVDAVMSVATIHWLPDHAGFFRNVAAVLRPGGRLVAEGGGSGNIASVRAALAALDADDDTTWNFAGVTETVAALRAAGFAEIEVTLARDPARLLPGEQLESFLATVVLGAHLQRIPDRAARRAFVTEVARRLPEPTVDYVRLRIEAVRADGQP